MRDVYISGTGSWLPEDTVSNEELYGKISNFEIDRAIKTLSKKHIVTEGSSDSEIFHKWVMQVTGIERRPFLKKGFFPNPKIEIEEMGRIALERALADAGLSADDLDFIVVSTYTQGRDIPAPAAKLIDFFGQNGKISGVTLNSACDGFNQALIDAVIRVESGYADHIAVVASEKMSDKVNFEDPTTAILFSDGAGACIVSKGRKGIFGFSSYVHYNDEHLEMNRGGFIEMGGGPLVQRNAVNAMKSAALSALEKSSKTMADVSYVIPHQANMRIIDLLKSKLELDQTQYFVRCLKDTGNLSSATVPVALDMLRKQKLSDVPYKKDGLAVLTSVGGGYSYSSVVTLV